MRVLILILLSMLVANCGNKSFSKDSKASNDNTFNQPNDPPGDDDDDDNDDDNSCPRYDLVVTSTHTSNKKLNFKYTGNAEMTHTSLQGTHKSSGAKAKDSPGAGS